MATSHEPRIPDAEETDRHGADLPEGTATDVTPPEGTSVDAPKVQGIYRPDVGPGGEDIDESAPALPNRYRTARRPT
jgi:hypothetical protein